MENQQHNEGFEANDAIGSNEGIGMNDSFETNETIAASDGNDAKEADETPKRKKKRRYTGMLSQLETYRLVLVNVHSQPEIAQKMAEMGYTPEVMSQGRKHFEEARSAYENCLARRHEKVRIYQEFKNLWNTLQENFTIHRQKGLTVFRGNMAAYMALSLNSSLPSRYLPLMARIKDFYTRISADEGLQQELANLSLTAEDVSKSLQMINEIEELRSTYMRKKAESQDATEKRNQAFSKSDQWTQDFFGMAKFAVRKSPQLQEAFGKIIRN